jgi:hypothetical protein
VRLPSRNQYNFGCVSFLFLLVFLIALAGISLRGKVIRVSRDSESANNVLPEEFLGSLRCYCGYCPCLDPLGKILDGDKGELEVHLGRE